MIISTRTILLLALHTLWAALVEQSAAFIKLSKFSNSGASFACQHLASGSEAFCRQRLPFIGTSFFHGFGPCHGENTSTDPQLLQCPK